MQNNVFTLLKYDLKNNSASNKSGSDKGRVPAMVGVLILFVMIGGVSFGAGYILSLIGASHLVMVFAIAAVTLVNFVFTLFKASGYMFAFKEYDMLMALPFSTMTIATEKFLFMYWRNLSMTFVIMLPALVGQLFVVRLGVLQILMWLIITLFSPMIPMTIATILGTFITGVGSKFKYKKVVQIILTLAIVLVGICARFLINNFFRDNSGAEVLGNKLKGVIDPISNYYFPSKWAGEAVANNNYISFLLFLLLSFAIFEISFLIISKNYKKINSRLKASTFHKDYKVGKMNVRSVRNTIMINEFRRFRNSVNYFVNFGMGVIIVLVLCVATLFVDIDKMLLAVEPSGELTSSVIAAATPFLVYFFIGLLPTTTVSYSLEGKNVWLLKSMPISGTSVINGKMMFNMILYTPFAIFGDIWLGIVLKESALHIVLFVVVSIILCSFSTVLGMFFGIKYAQLRWEHEIEVIKRSRAAGVYMLPNLLMSMALVVAASVFGDTYSVQFLIGSGVVVAIITAFIYKSVNKKANKIFS